MKHPTWCAAGRCTATRGLGGLHRSDPVRLPTDPPSVVALWLANPSRENPDPAPYVVLLAEQEAVVDAVTLPYDRRHERRVFRAELRRHVAALTACMRRAA